MEGAFGIVVIKLGGSVVSQKQSGAKELSSTAFEICKYVEICRLHKRRPILVCGAGSFGHQSAVKFGFDTSVKSGEARVEKYLQAMVVRREVRELVTQIERILMENGISCYLISPLWETLTNGDIVLQNENALSCLLDNNVVPLFHGDMMMNETIPRVLSGDTICEVLAHQTRVKELIFVSKNALFDIDPAHPDARRIDEITLSTRLCNNKSFSLDEVVAGPSGDASGGMATKLKSLTKVLTANQSLAVFIVPDDGHITVHLESIFEHGDSKGCTKIVN